MERLKHRLGELQRRLTALPAAKQPPPTTLQILGNGTQERAWQRLLVHFLTPDGAHGLSRDLLEHLLTALANRNDLDYSFSWLDLDTVAVAQEVATSQGRPDAVIWSAEDWFICFELKIDAAEGNDQTERYVAVDSFEGIGVEKDAVPTDRHHYVYLAPVQASSPASDEFVHVSWSWVADQLQSFLTDSYGEYPTRTTAQLEDFIDTIRSELTMTEYQENQREKMELYVQYSEAIAEAEQAFEAEWENFVDEWGDNLATTIEGGTTVEAPDVPDEYAVFSFDRGDDQWIFRQTHSDWAWIFKDGWWRHAETGESVYDYDSSRPDTRVGFLHRLEKHREEALGDGELKFFFRSAPPNVDAFSEAFVNEFNNEPGHERIRAAKPDRMEFTGNTRMLLEGTYEIDTTAGNGFLDAYVTALATAFLDNVDEHEALVTAIDDLYEEAFAAY